MNKIVLTIVLLALAVAAAAFYGNPTFREQIFSHKRTAAGFNQAFNRYEAQAAREYPGMSKDEALKKFMAKKTEKSLAMKSGTQLQKSAAEYFFGFYYVNTELRVEYCDQLGVDLTAFTDVFKAAHEKDLARATRIFQSAGDSPEAWLLIAHDSAAKLVEQNMKGLAESAQIPVKGACSLYNDSPQAFVDSIVLPPQVEQALISAN